MGETLLTFEELTTLLCQIEACLNSRPLCPMSNDPDDYTILTPGHFLIGEAPITIPEPTLLDVQTNRLNRYQLLQKMYQHFWRIWSSEYLSRLQQRPKWMKSSDNLVIGQLVLIKEESIPPSKWSLGRVIQTHPGSDGRVRVVTLKGQNGIYKRPVTKLCLLPISDNHHNAEQSLKYQNTLGRPAMLGTSNNDLSSTVPPTDGYNTSSTTPTSDNTSSTTSHRTTHQ